MDTTNRTPKLLARLQLLIACLLWTLTPVAALAGDAKPKITRQADLPRFSYRLPGSASRFVESDEATFAPFAARVRADLDKVLADYEIEDRSTLRQILAAKVDLQELAGDYGGGLRTVDALRALEDKPASRLLSGLTARARLQAALDTGNASGPAYEQAFRKRYQAQVMPLPWDVTQDGIRTGYRFARLNSRAATLAEVKTELDPALAKSGALDAPQAWALVSAHNNLKFGLPLSAAQAEVLRDYIAGHDVAKPDIWAAREVTLTERDKL
ncbi:MAG TPA: hypothetical protein VGK95_01755, partial [Caldimonas sp.]